MAKNVSTESPTKLTFWVLIGIAAVLVMLAVLGNQLGWELIHIGYDSVSLPNGLEAGTRGYVINGLTSLLFALALTTAVTAAFIKAGGRYRARLPVPVTALIMWLLFNVLLVIFYPSALEVQVRHYSGPAFIDFFSLRDRKGSFQGSADKSQMLTYYQDCAARSEQCPVYECVTEKQWWFGGFQKIQGFYPGLDIENQKKLLDQYCQTALLK
ncbi:hypothetical protein [Pseudomonas sp. WAC2]|uniref:hypothetical protein n=1 Tax=Pseudomonas sp. WAC2 TaxID=3055057 RepID=UPI0025AF82B7|nr:hypothetical protein [Pseudomonas sp. WAC2]MDN3236881.1 hypothetical protein [Pseudomonas sp. WAC2]